VAGRDRQFIEASARETWHAEVPLLVLLCAVVFVPGLAQLPYYGTEPLRALITQEMYASGDWLHPTVHHHPYIEKPPLAAWCIAGLSGLLLQPQVTELTARIPSVMAATAYVLLIYAAARSMVSPRCGFTAALFALCNSSFLEYAVRAELDIPFMFFFALASLLVWPMARVVLAPAVSENTHDSTLTTHHLWRQWSLVYAALVIATLWKGPHALVFMFLTLLFVTVKGHSCRWLFHPAHVVTGTLAVAIVAAWYLFLAHGVGGSKMGQWFLMEMYHRMVPKSLEYVQHLATAPLQAYLATLPAAFLAGLLIFRSVRHAIAPEQRPLMQFLWLWFAPSMVFIMLSRCDSTRYLFPIFAPVTLLGALVWEHYWQSLDATSVSREPALPSAGKRFVEALIIGLAAGGALLPLILMVACATGRLPDYGTPPAYRWLALPVAGSALLLALWTLRVRRRSRPSALILGLISALLATKAGHHLWYAPSRAAEYEHARVVRELSVAAHDGPLFVHARTPMPDVLVYYPFETRRLDQPEDAFRLTRGRPAYFVMRERSADKTPPLPFAPDRVREVARVKTAKTTVRVMEVLPPGRASLPASRLGANLALAWPR
jgi:4-amino-4-deoxy-L-arabinose transferase-like glycosyltransferase